MKWDCSRAGGRAFVVVFLVGVIAIMSGLTSPAAAQVFNWTNSTGGLFNTPANWSPAGGPPDTAGESALFDLNNTYTVTLTTPVAHGPATVTNGTVTFALSGQPYTLNGGLALLSVGTVTAQTARLTLLNGHMGADVLIGSNVAATGFLTIGDDATLDTNVNSTFVGTLGTGTLTVTDGGRFLNANGGSVEVGDGPSGNGTLLVSGAGSRLTAGLLVIGDQGTGSATISGGGSVVTANTMSIGVAASGDGAVTVTGAGSTLDVPSLVVGNAGAGAFTVAAGAAATMSSGQIGAFAGASGHVTLTGAGSSIQHSVGTFNVGGLGAGTLDVLAGASLVTAAANVAQSPGSSGAATVSGAGTSWTTGQLVVGGMSNTNGGSGTLTIDDGAAVVVNSGMEIRPTGGTAVTIDGGGSLTVSTVFNRLGVLNHRDGLLHIKGNYTHAASVQPLIIDGLADDDLPTMRLSGTGSSTNINTLTVGSNRRGALILDGGRQMVLGANPVSIGAGAMSSGSITVDSAAVLTNTSSFNVGSTFGGVGELAITRGGRVEAGTFNLRPTGTVHIDGGTLRMGFFNPGGTFDFDSGTVHFTSTANLSAARLDSLLGAGHVLGFGRTVSSDDVVTVDAPITINGGTLAAAAGMAINNPVELLGGTLSSASDLFNNPGRVVRVAGTGALNVVGTFTNNGILQLEENLVALSGGTLSNDGTIRGSGIIANNLSNNSGGEIRAALASERIVFAGDVNINNGAINASGGGGTVEFDQPITNNAQINLTDGVVRVASNLTNSATGRIAGRGTLAAVLTINNGQIQMSGGVSDVFGTIHNNAGGRLLVTGGGTTTFYGNIDNGGGANIAVAANSSAIFLGNVTGVGTMTGSGTKYFADGTSSVDTIASSSGATVVEFDAALTATHVREASLAVHGEMTMASNGTSSGTSKVGALEVSETGSLDLSNNKLIVVGGDVGAFDGVGYSGLSGRIASAYNFSSWDGPGIKTSQFDAGPLRGVTTLAIATADEVFYAGGTFGGLPTSSGDVLVMYTYAGDLNLDGLVDGADYGYIDNYVQFPGTSGYTNGDINYDGVIDGADYGIIDNSIQLQGDPFPSGTYGAASTLAGVAAVPEPAACGFAIVTAAAAAIFSRRRNRPGFAGTSAKT